MVSDKMMELIALKEKDYRILEEESTTGSIRYYIAKKIGGDFVKFPHEQSSGIVRRFFGEENHIYHNIETARREAHSLAMCDAQKEDEESSAIKTVIHDV